MSDETKSCPLTAEQVVDQYFLEHRAKLIDIAAFLDRVERAGGNDDDFRMVAFRRALALLADRGAERARRVLEIFSDPTSEPLESAEGMKGAAGAWPGRSTPAGKGSR